MEPARLLPPPRSLLCVLHPPSPILPVFHIPKCAGEGLGEFLCPICRRLGNALLPVTAAVSMTAAPLLAYPQHQHQQLQPSAPAEGERPPDLLESVARLGQAVAAGWVWECAAPEAFAWVTEWGTEDGGQLGAPGPLQSPERAFYSPRLGNMVSPLKCGELREHPRTALGNPK